MLLALATLCYNSIDYVIGSEVNRQMTCDVISGYAPII